MLADCDERDLQNDTSDATVIAFKPGGAGCSFFFVADLNGSAFGHRHLAAHLDSSHAAYGLNAPSWFITASAVSVESMAANYATQIEKVVSPGGKVIVVGYSFGGTLAFELASQLRKRGIVDPLPIIIDMPALNAPGMQASTLQRQMLDVLCNLPAWTAQEAVNFHPREFLSRCYANLRRVTRLLVGRAPDRELDPLIYFGEANMPSAYQAFMAAMYQAMNVYVPAKYEGKVVLLRAKVPTLFRNHHVTMGWEAVASCGVDVHLIPGRHDDCVSKVHARDLAAVLVSCANAFESN